MFHLQYQYHLVRSNQKVLMHIYIYIYIYIYMYIYIYKHTVFQSKTSTNFFLALEWILLFNCTGICFPDALLKEVSLSVYIYYAGAIVMQEILTLLFKHLRLT